MHLQLSFDLVGVTIQLERDYVDIRSISGLGNTKRTSSCSK